MSETTEVLEVTLSDLIDQAHQIKNLVYKIQDQLTSYTVVNFFQSNPEQTQQVLASTEEIRSRRLVLYGLAERLQSAVLPLRDVLAERSDDWLEVGDIIVGWQGALIDKPRVILDITEDGYLWRFYDEEDQRNPVALDRFYQHVGWEKLGADLAIEEIHAIQQEEIDVLTEKLDYFSGREFLNA